MKKLFIYTFFVFILCSSNTISAQCQFGDRYSDCYLNIKKRNKIGDTSAVHYYSNGEYTYFILKRVDFHNNYHYKRDVGYLSRITIKFDSTGRVGMFYYKYNSGFWGSAGHGTEFKNYFDNGNIQLTGWKEKKRGGITFYDTLDHVECDADKLIKLKKFKCVKFCSKWYIILGNQPDLGSYGFFKRRTFIRTNKKNLRRIEINWKDGFSIEPAIVKELIG